MMRDNLDVNVTVNSTRIDAMTLKHIIFDKLQIRFTKPEFDDELFIQCIKHQVKNIKTFYSYDFQNDPKLEIEFDTKLALHEKDVDITDVDILLVELIKEFLAKKDEKINLFIDIYRYGTNTNTTNAFEHEEKSFTLNDMQFLEDNFVRYMLHKEVNVEVDYDDSFPESNYVTLKCYSFKPTVDTYNEVVLALATYLNDTNQKQENDYDLYVINDSLLCFRRRIHVSKRYGRFRINSKELFTVLTLLKEQLKKKLGIDASIMCRENIIFIETYDHNFTNKENDLLDTLINGLSHNERLNVYNPLNQGFIDEKRALINIQIPVDIGDVINYPNALVRNYGISFIDESKRDAVIEYFDTLRKSNMVYFYQTDVKLVDFHPNNLIGIIFSGLSENDMETIINGFEEIAYGYKNEKDENPYSKITEIHIIPRYIHYPSYIEDKADSLITLHVKEGSFYPDNFRDFIYRAFPYDEIVDEKIMKGKSIVHDPIRQDVTSCIIDIHVLQIAGHTIEETKENFKSHCQMFPKLL